MNAAEKKRAAAIGGDLETAGATLESLAAELATMRDAEQERYDALGDRAKEGDRGVALEAAATALGVASDKAQEAFDALQEAANELYGIDGVRND